MTTTIKTIIVEDNEFEVIQLQEALQAYPNIKVIASFHNGRVGLEGIHELNPDLVFVDVEMPEMSGFEMLSKLELNPVIIFYSGKLEYAPESIDYDAAGFIHKPLNPNRLDKSLRKALSLIHDSGNRTQRLEQQKKYSGNIELHFTISGTTQKKWVWHENILCVKSNREYNQYLVVQEPGVIEEFSQHESLREAEQKLEPLGLIKVHRSWIINPKYMENWIPGKRKLKLKYMDEYVAVSRDKKQTLEQLWEEQNFWK